MFFFFTVLALTPSPPLGQILAPWKLMGVLPQTSMALLWPAIFLLFFLSILKGQESMGNRSLWHTVKRENQKHMFPTPKEVHVGLIPSKSSFTAFFLLMRELLNSTDISPLMCSTGVTVFPFSPSLWETDFQESQISRPGFLALRASATHCMWITLKNQKSSCRMLGCLKNLPTLQVPEWDLSFNWGCSSWESDPEKSGLHCGSSLLLLLWLGLLFMGKPRTTKD